MVATQMIQAIEPFKQEKAVPPNLEWNREFICTNDSKLRFRVKSSEPLSISIIADRLYQAAKEGNKAGIVREDMILTLDCIEPEFEGIVRIKKQGTYWFVLKNRSNKEVNMELVFAKAQ